MHPPKHIYTCHASHILWKNLQAYNIQDRVGWKKEHNTFPFFRKCVTTQQVSHHSFPNPHHIQFTEYFSGIHPPSFQKELITT